MTTAPVRKSAVAQRLKPAAAAGIGLLVGEPQDAYGYQPMWFKAGLIAMALVGVVVGVFLNVGLTAD